jgi:hypothetical protein
MKNDIKLLSEQIGRIQEIMGITKKNLLSEQPVGTKVWEFLTFIFEKDATKLSAEEIGNKLKTLSNKLGDDVNMVSNAAETVIEKYKTGILTDGEKEFISSLIRTLDPVGVKSMALTAINFLKTSHPTSSDSLLKMLNDNSFKNEEIYPYIKKYFPTVDDVSLTLLRDEIQKNPIEFKPLPEPPKPEPIPEPKPEPEPIPEPDNVDDVIPKNVGEAEKVLKQTQDPNFFMMVLESFRQSPPISWIWDGISKIFNLKYTNVISATVDDITNRLELTYGEIIKKLESKENSNIDDEMKKLIGIYNEFLEKKDIATKNLYVEMSNTFKNDELIGRLFKEKNNILDKKTGEVIGTEPNHLYIKLYDDPKFHEIINILDNKSQSEIKKVELTYSKFNGSLRMWKNFTTIINPLNLVNGNIVKYGLAWSEFAQRLIFIVTHYSPNTLKEIAYNYKVLGRKRWLANGFGQKLVISLVQAPLLISVYRSISSSVQDFYDAKYRAKGQVPPKPNWWMVRDPEIDQYRNSIMGEFKLIVNNYLKNVNFVALHLETVGSWSLAAWGAFQAIPVNSSASQFIEQQKNVEDNAKKTSDSLFSDGKNDKQLQIVIDSLKVPTYEDTIKNVTDTIQNSGVKIENFDIFKKTNNK